MEASTPCPGGHPIFNFSKKLPGDQAAAADAKARAIVGAGPGPVVVASPAAAQTKPVGGSGDGGGSGGGGATAAGAELAAALANLRWCKKCKTTFEGKSCKGGHANFMCSPSDRRGHHCPSPRIDLAGREL